MKKIFILIIILSVFIFSGYSQVIPFGNSQDSVSVYNEYKYWTYGPVDYDLYYYKPVNYDSVNSPILFYIHGLGGTGAEATTVLSNIAERQNALIIAPTMKDGWNYGKTSYIDTNDCVYFTWYPPIIKQIYRHVLLRENRDTIPVYLTGFSAGGQFVTRYMLIRQAIMDSIPIKMAVSVNPYSYTFCTDSLDSMEMVYPCGISHCFAYSGCNFIWTVRDILDFDCDGHVLQYYNENYGILIGTTDTAYGTGWCWTPQGTNRYERAQNFYAFSDTNAVTRGTTLNWQYVEIPGIAHDGWAMYNTKAIPTDTVTIAETLLFDTPYQTVPNFLPVANFSYADLGLTINFSDLSLYSSIWHWNFGDGDTSIMQNPQHTYAVSGTYYVCLTAGDSCITDTYCDSITVTNTGINELINESYLDFRAYPNPFKQSTTINFAVPEEGNIKLEIYNYSGRLIATLFNGNAEANKLYKINFDTKELHSGIYFGVMKTSGDSKIKKLIIIK